MKVRVEVVSLNTDGEEQRRQILTIERRELAMETLGVNLTEGKALLAGVQDFVCLPTGTRRVGATTCLSTLPQAVHDQGLRQHLG
jgi:hypothetical protein